MTTDSSQIILGRLIPILLNFSIMIALFVFAVYGFILLVKFLKAGTKAFNIYIEKNNNSYLKETENDKQKSE